MKLIDLPTRKPSINLTPLIDILIILIIFFVVSSKITSELGVNINLPESQQSQSAPQDLPTLLVSKSQQFVFQSEVYPLETLSEAFQEYLSQQSQKTLILNIDQDVEHGLVLKLMDVAKRAGFKKVVFGAVRPSELP